MKRLTTIIFGLALAVALMASTSLANHSWGGYHWATTEDSSVGVPLDNKLSAGWTSFFDQVFPDWKVSAVDIAETSSGAGGDACDPGNSETTFNAVGAGKVAVCNQAYGNNGWLGLARLWLRGDGHIDRAQALMNDSYLATSQYTDTARRNVLCHEIGHTLGLDHRKGPKATSCMNDMWGLSNPDYMRPDTHDYDQLAAIYCHADSSCTSEGDGGGGGGKGNGKGPKKQGSHGPYITKQGRHTVVTWVTWKNRH